MSSISAKQRRHRLARVIEAYGHVCWICDIEIDLSLPRDHDEALTVDHVLPQSRGGSNWLPNLRPAHRCCNEARRNPRVEMAA